MGQQCQCKKGYKSTQDNKCLNCRTKEEQRLHSAKMTELEQYLVTIGNKYHGDTGEYIGRGSPLGNPFVIGEHGDRDQVIEAYREWLKNKVVKHDTAVIAELERLAYILLDTKRLKLLCFCSPKPCHGAVIRDVLYKVLYDHCTPTRKGKNS